MARKKKGNGESSMARSTRSSSRFSALEVTDEEFPSLQVANFPTPGKVNKDDTGRDVGQTVNSGQRVGTAVVRSQAVVENAIAVKMLETTKRKQSVQADASSLVINQAAMVSASKPITGKLVQESTQQHTVKEIDIGVKPWSTLFKDNRDPTHGIKLKYIPPKGKELDFTDKVMPFMVEMWGYCLVGCFTGRFLGLKAIHELKWKWGVKCLVITHDRVWVIFKFQNESDRTKVLNEGPYTIFGKQLMLKELSEDFSFEDEEFLKVPIWVKFPKLPWKLWNDEAMSEVASMVGIPLTTDKITQEKTNYNIARVLIEVDVSKPPQLSFPIRLSFRKIFKQTVVYETFPNYCFQCKEYGHHPFICKKLAPTVQNVSKETEKLDSTHVVKRKEAAHSDILVEQGRNILDNNDELTREEPVDTLFGQEGNILETTIVPTVTVREERYIVETDVHDVDTAALETVITEPAMLDGNKTAKKKKKKMVSPETKQSGARVPERTESDSSGYYSYETASSEEEDLGPDFDEVYMDGKVFTIRKDANVKL
ncbi:unnamed protein product [Cuscuta epithymum]|uniref:DUF4283 domain-containing protein n=1 Tax=Cuscuta epithymum TaxID=186058 RepID=A0AAV0FH16_9ASTE|nr:unnamed protein product [Cuscuta epithymum]